MPHASYKTTIYAPYDRVHTLLVDKKEHPKKYVGSILFSKIIEKADGYIIRQMYEPKPVDLTITEKIYERPVDGGEEFVYEHMDNAIYDGVFRNVLKRVGGRDDAVELEYVMDWTPHQGVKDKLTKEAAERIVQNGVHHLKAMAENPVRIPDFARAFFDAVDSMNPEAARPLLTEDCKFRIGNGGQITGPDRLVATYRELRDMFSAIRHDCVAVNAQGSRTFVECFVEYTTHDGACYLLAFMTVFETQGGKISDVRIYGDLSPAHYGWRV